MRDEPFALPAGAALRARLRRAAGEDGVIDFASWVVDLLAARRAAADGVMRPALLARLVTAVSDPDPGPLAALMRDLVRQKVAASAVADLYIPAAAAQLGDAWMDDRVGFPDVTLAGARLQAMLRALGAAWGADRAEARQRGRAGARSAEPCLLLCVAPGEQHTLGALVLLGQLRRAGVSVRLVTDPAAEDMAALMAAVRFDGVLISASGSAGLVALTEFVQRLRSLGPRGLRIVLGGGVLGAVPGAVRIAGADAGACDVAQALAGCGLGWHEDGRTRLLA